MNSLLKHFSLDSEIEDVPKIIEDIEKNIAFHGTNLWVLIFAIFVASLGLNVNSTAVIIGAMLISPLMGPIMGLGLGMGINDLWLLRKSLFNYLFAAGVSLGTSTLYFLITPISTAHSEILARTSPNIYDVLIALFGGLAGIVAVSSKHKGNVIPGVAIATALMPPLCTAGYGLATLQMAYFFGAFYLFLINTVFIALATLVVVRLLKFPYKKLQDPQAEKRANRIAWIVVTATLLPSLYLGYDIVQQERFHQSANRFIQNEAHFPNDYLLEKTIEPRKKTIMLTYGGKKITEQEIEQLKKKLAYYNLETVNLSIRQGFEYLNEIKQTAEESPLKQILAEKEVELNALKTTLDSLNTKEMNTNQLVKEIKALYPDFKNMAFTKFHTTDSLTGKNLERHLAYLQFSKALNSVEKKRVQHWLELKLNLPLKVVFEP